MMKYEDKDFEKVIDGEVSINDMCDKYGVARKTFIRAMNKKGYFIKKTKIKIISPHKTKTVYSYSACADELGVSERTVRNALKGKHIKLFDDMGIKVEIVQ